MAELVYTEEGRLVFTKEMKDEYTILMPMMLPIHFGFIQKIFEQHGYRIVLLDSVDKEIVDEGLRDVHNDICYPALLTTGQLMHALKTGDYDLNKVALMMSQTGGGCRASNYIHLIRKALKNQGLSHIPVVSFNVSGMEKNPGFKLGPRIILQLLSAVNYGDVLMSLSNQTRPYEVNKGETDALIATWQDRLLEEMKHSVNLRPKRVIENIEQIARDFEQIERKQVPRVKVGIVGEIYIKYAALGNNNLEDLLAEEGAEVVMPSLLGFVMYCIYNVVNDYRLYKTKYLLSLGGKALMNFLYNYQDKMNAAIEKNSTFTTIPNFSHTIAAAEGYVDTGVKMGEGWFLTAEMLELIHMGVDNIVCTQPFGCLPNHIVGKGMMRIIKKNYPLANIVAIDYDASATRINQENRIKLMLATAKKNLEKSLDKEANDAPPNDEAVVIERAI